MSEKTDDANCGLFTESLATFIVPKLSPTSSKPQKKRAGKGRRNEHTRRDHVEIDEAGVGIGDEVSDFVEYIAEETFYNLPHDLQTISYSMLRNGENTAEKFDLPLDTSVIENVAKTLPPSVAESLCSYGLMEEPSDIERFLDHVLTRYIETATLAPPEYTPEVTASRPDGCEICGREHVPLTYHHLIPRQIHTKAVKRGWHKEWELNKVSWLCRACHSYVHKIATNEELARDLYDVDLLLEREDVQKWAAWVGKVRWKAR